MWKDDEQFLHDGINIGNFSNNLLLEAKVLYQIYWKKMQIS